MKAKFKYVRLLVFIIVCMYIWWVRIQRNREKRSDAAVTLDKYNLGERQMNRVRQLNEVCRRKESYLTHTFKHGSDELIFYNRNKNWIGCKIRKSGSTMMEETILYGSESLSRLFIEGQDEQINRSFKFIFVRHPIDRLWSSYVGQFINTEPKKIKAYGIPIIKRYRKNPDKMSLLCAHNITFEEYLRYITDLQQQGQPPDGHWSPYYNLCNPCEIGYDFIGKLETFNEDMPLLYEKLNLSERTPVSLKYLISAHCRDFSGDIELDPYCADINALMRRKWRSFIYGGIVDPSEPVGKIPESLKRQPTSVSQWKAFCNATVHKYLLHAAKDMSVEELMKKRKEKAMLRAYSDVSGETKQSVKSIYEFDMALFDYKDYI